MQALWSPATMQNLGLLYALEPALKRTYSTVEERRDAAMRHLSYFNTNPYMGGFVLGFVARLEESSDDSRIEKLKKAMGAALAAVGDASVWGSLQPACAGFAALAAVIAWSMDFAWAALVCAVLYLLLFNIPTLWIRWRGISMGYELGETLPIALQEWHWQNKARWIRRAGLACAVLAPAYLIVRESRFIGAYALIPAVAILAVVVLRRRGFSSAALYGLCFAAAVGFQGVILLP